MNEYRYSELKFNGEIYTEQWKIDEILIKNKFNWMVNAEIKNARLEIFNDTLVWNAGIWYNGDWYFGVWRDGEWRYGTWQNGVFYNGVWRNGTFKSGIIYNGKFFKGKIESGEIRGGQFIDIEIAPNVVEYTGDEYQAKKEEEQQAQQMVTAVAEPQQPGQVKVRSTPPASQQFTVQPQIQQERKNNNYKMKKIKTFESFSDSEEEFDSLEDELASRREYLPDDVTCPDCDGDGVDEFGEECGRCDGTGRVYRPDDIPPDDFDFDEDFEDENESLVVKGFEDEELLTQLGYMLNKAEDMLHKYNPNDYEVGDWEDAIDKLTDLQFDLDEDDDDYKDIENLIDQIGDLHSKMLDIPSNESVNTKKIKSFKSFRESVGEYEDSFVDINIDETELEDSDRPNLGKLKQKPGKIIIETPSNTDAYNAKMRLGGDVIQEPGFSDKQMHHVKSITEIFSKIEEDLTKTVTTGSGWEQKQKTVTVGNLTLNSYAKKLYSLFKKEGAKVWLFSTAITKVGDMNNYQVGIDTASTKGSGIKVTINAGQNSMNMANKYVPLILKTFPDLEIIEKPSIIQGWGNTVGVDFIMMPKKGTNLT